MYRGYTKRWRKRWEKEYHKDRLLWVIMDYFIDHANHRDSEVYMKGAGVVPLKRGQHIFGTLKLAEFMGVDRQRIRSKLKILKNIKFLTIKSTNRYSIATIINYNTYNPLKNETNQLTDQQLTSNQPATNQQLTTPNNVKNVKECKNNENKDSPPIVPLSNDFDQFWNTYPKKVGKKLCFDIWKNPKKRNGRPPIDILVQIIEKQKQSEDWTKEDGRYIPNPSTWLNQGRWDDELKMTHPLKGRVSDRTIKNMQTLENWERRHEGSKAIQ